MKIINLANSSGRPLTRARAVTALLINQFASPGLGTVLAGRVLVGALQFTMALAGVVLVFVWFFKFMVYYYGLINFGSAQGEFDQHWLALVGGALFVLAWFWSLITSLLLLREGSKNDAQRLPPPIQNQNREA